MSTAKKKTTSNPKTAKKGTLKDMTAGKEVKGGGKHGHGATNAALRFRGN